MGARVHRAVLKHSPVYTMYVLYCVFHQTSMKYMSLTVYIKVEEYCAAQTG